MTNDKTVEVLAKFMENMNRNICENLTNPGPVILFPGYEDWKAEKCRLERSDDSLSAYWKERNETIRRYNTDTRWLP